MLTLSAEHENAYVWLAHEPTPEPEANAHADDHVGKTAGGEYGRDKGRWDGGYGGWCVVGRGWWVEGTLDAADGLGPRVRAVGATRFPHASTPKQSERLHEQRDRTKCAIQ